MTLLAVAGLALVLATRRPDRPPRPRRGARRRRAWWGRWSGGGSARPWPPSRCSPSPPRPRDRPWTASGGRRTWRGTAAGGASIPAPGCWSTSPRRCAGTRATVNSPTGSERGPGRFVDVRQQLRGGRGRPRAGGLGDDPPAVALPAPAVRGGPGRGPPGRPPDLAAGRPGARPGGLGRAQRGRGALPGGRRPAGLPGAAGPALDRASTGPSTPGPGRRSASGCRWRSTSPPGRGRRCA